MSHPGPNDPEPGDVVACFDADGYYYIALVHAVSVHHDSYELLFADTSLTWVGEENVRKLPIIFGSVVSQPAQESSKVEDLDAASRKIDPEQLSDSDEEVICSMPVDAEEPILESWPPPSLLSRKPSMLPSNFTKDPRKKRFSLRRPKLPKPSRLSRLCPCVKPYDQL